MIVWDRGVFENISKTRQRRAAGRSTEALEKGDLKIFLLGEKVKGAYALVRTSDPGDREQWLLIKKKGEGADARRQPDLDASPSRCSAAGRSSRCARRRAEPVSDREVDADVALPATACSTSPASSSASGWSALVPARGTCPRRSAVAAAVIGVGVWAGARRLRDEALHQARDADRPPASRSNTAGHLGPIPLHPQPDVRRHGLPLRRASRSALGRALGARLPAGWSSSSSTAA